MMLLATEPYTEQIKVWPRAGRHIIAHYDDSSIVVYQAYRPSIGRYAVEHGRLGGSEFGYSRMSWIKPNFLWMMYRSGWGTKENQEATLALRLRREFFESMLTQAVESSFNEECHSTREAWQQALTESSVRLQWDPDHDPFGAKQERRALQLGLRGEVLRAFGTRELLEVIDLSGFVAEQRSVLLTTGIANLYIPREQVYRPKDPEVVRRLCLSAQSGS